MQTVMDGWSLEPLGQGALLASLDDHSISCEQKYGPLHQRPQLLRDKDLQSRIRVSDISSE